MNKAEDKFSALEGGASKSNDHTSNCPCCNPLSIWGEIDRENESERGNILWFILIAVALLAAITMVLSRGGSSSDQAGDYEQLSIKASQILRYASGIEKAIEQVKATNGCAENDISFENSVSTGYSNANSPSDESCHIFETAGGGQSWQAITTETATSLGNENMYMTGDLIVTGVGRDIGADGVLSIAVSQALCEHINTKFGISNTASDITSDLTAYSAKYTGSFPASFSIGVGAGQAPALDGERTGCFIDDQGEYIFYHVLMPR